MLESPSTGDVLHSALFAVSRIVDLQLLDGELLE
jgi:hypothetical protein